MYDAIDRLVTNEIFDLQVWNDPLTRRVWVALDCGLGEFDFFRKLHQDLDNEHCYDDYLDEAQDLVLSTDWLPCVTGTSFGEAMIKLESRLATLPSDELIRESDWNFLVSCATQDLKAIYLLPSSDSREGFPSVLRKPFDEAVKTMKARGWTYKRPSRVS